jgi:hypothetical protein
MYASNVRLSTVAQSKSRLSSVTFSEVSWAVLVAFNEISLLRRAIRSPSANCGPRSGKFREGSNGFHLINCERRCEAWAVNGLPEVVEVIRVCAPEESLESERLRGGTILRGSIEEISKPNQN